MPTLEERLEALERALSTLKTERISDVRQLDERINALQQQIDEQRRLLSERASAQDMTASFNQLAVYQIQTEQKIDARFDQVEARLDKIEANMATKEDIANMATKADIANMATKEDIANMATKEDIANMATKEDIANMATKEDIANMATKEDIANMATKADMAALELRMQGNMHAMEGRMLDAFKQMLVMIDSRLPPPTP